MTEEQLQKGQRSLGLDGSWVSIATHASNSQEPRPFLAAQRFEKQSRPSAVAISQVAKDTKGDNQEARLLFLFVLRKFCWGMWRVLLNYFSSTICFGR